RWLPLQVAMTVEKPEAAARPRNDTAPPARVMAPPRRASANATAAAAPPESGTNWRARLGSGAPATTNVITNANANVNVDANVNAAADGDGDGDVAVDANLDAHDESSAPAPSPADPLHARRTDDDDEPPADWRAALCDWAQVALGTAQRIALPPVDDASPLGDAVARTGLDAPAACALALLYASWLLGDGERGLPAASIARAVVRAAGDPERAWAEALGRGALAAAGLVRRRAGRLRLRSVTARFLDGAEPRVTITQPASGQPAVPARGLYVLERSDAPLDRLPQALADRLGRGVALVVPPPASSLPPEPVVEARLHDAVPLVMIGDAAPGDWLEARDALTVLVSLDADAAGLAHLPTLALP